MKVDSDATWNKYVAGSALCRAEFSTVRAGCASLTVLPDRGSAIMGGVTTADPDSVLPDVKTTVPVGRTSSSILQAKDKGRVRSAMVRTLRMLPWPMLTRPGWYLTSVNALAEESIHGNFELYMKDLLFTMVFNRFA